MRLLKFDKESGELFFENGVYLGDIIRNIDGYYDFWPKIKGGYWESAILHEIANLLDEMNKDWDEEVKRYNEM